jgi:hypothetical protein
MNRDSQVRPPVPTRASDAGMNAEHDLTMQPVTVDRRSVESPSGPHGRLEPQQDLP